MILFLFFLYGLLAVASGVSLARGWATSDPPFSFLGAVLGYLAFDGIRALFSLIDRYNDARRHQ